MNSTAVLRTVPVAVLVPYGTRLHCNVQVFFTRIPIDQYPVEKLTHRPAAAPATTGTASVRSTTTVVVPGWAVERGYRGTPCRRRACFCRPLEPYSVLFIDLLVVLL